MGLAQHYRRRAAWSLAAAAGLALAAALTWAVVYHSASVATVDSRLYRDLYLAGKHRTIQHFALLMTSLCGVGPYDVLGAVAVVLALLRRRVSLAIGAVVIMAGAILLAELLKRLLHVPHAAPPWPELSIGRTWPSGHTAAAAGLALAWVLAAPRRLRRHAALLGAAFTLSVGYSVLALGWHYPSDTLGGVLVTGAWAALVLAGLTMLRRGRVARET